MKNKNKQIAHGQVENSSKTLVKDTPVKTMSDTAKDKSKKKEKEEDEKV